MFHEEVQKRNNGMSLARRRFLADGSLMLAAGLFGAAAQGGGEDSPSLLRVGLVTDMHYADKATSGTRHYRDTLLKLEEAGELFEREKPDFIAELGDFIDAADSVSDELSFLRTINAAFEQISPERHYVLGNHCVDTLRKQEFLDQVAQAKSYYSFDKSGIHFVVLDACFRSDGKPYGRKNSKWDDANIPPEELEWLKADLATGKEPVIVFVHQRLDVSTSHGIKNNAQVRKVFEASGRVRAVFQGHSHQNDVKEIGGIPYCTLVAMVEGSGPENSGYSLMEIRASGDIYVKGFRNQVSRSWPS